jgi:hypothetical protein
MRTSRVSALRPAYSCSQTAATTPSGMTITDISSTIKTVPKNRRQRAIFTAARGGRVTDKLPDLTEEMPDFLPEAQAVWIPGGHHLRQRNQMIVALHVAQHQRIALAFMLQMRQLLRQRAEAFMQRRAVGIQF